MKKSSKRFLTIFVLPSDSSKARKYRIPQGLYRAGKVVALLMFIVFAYVVIDYGNMALKVQELNKLRRENTAQKIELRKLSTRIDNLEKRLVRLQLFDKKLRIIANLETPSSTDRELLGMGGTGADEYFLNMDKAKDDLVSKMHSEINQLEEEAKLQERSFTELEEFLLEQAALLASTPSVWPTRGWLTSRFGKRRDPFTGRIQMHKGIDIANRVGTDVIAPADGIVTRITKMHSLGRLVEISHGYGIRTRYGHLSKVLVRVGQKVKRGQKIAEMGNTGRSTGPHLHYEVIANGIHVNPLRYILN
ncbi:MAG TPA: peptidase M23 [Deltaproteobacteria bacterium]|nr:peptidase M23 [Deltaproteobacteria bacterium]